MRCYESARRIGIAALAVLCTVMSAGCGDAEPQAEDFEYVGSLSVVVVPGTYDLVSEVIPFLEAEGEDFRLSFNDETEFTNVESSELGQLWHTGGRYGVNGTLEGEIIHVKSIAYLDDD